MSKMFLWLRPCPRPRGGVHSAPPNLLAGVGAGRGGVGRG